MLDPDRSRIRSSGTSNPSPRARRGSSRPGARSGSRRRRGSRPASTAPVSARAASAADRPPLTRKTPSRRSRASGAPPGRAGDGSEARVDDLGSTTGDSVSRAAIGRVVAVALHPQRKRLHAAQGEEAVERPGTAPIEFWTKCSRSARSRRRCARRTADHVRVAADVLGRRVHDDVGAERQRLLEIRAGEGVVDDDERAGRMRRARRSPRCRRS